MNCPTCGRPTRLLRTEQISVGAARSVRLCTAPTSHAHPHAEFETVEVLAAVMSGFGPARIEHELRRARRGIARRDEQQRRRKKVEQFLGRGLTPSQVARAAGITEARVRQIRAELSNS